MSSKSVFSTLGATSHSKTEREADDFYATDPVAARCLIGETKRLGLTLPSNVWECACGDGKLSQVFESAGYNVLSTDLVDRGFGKAGVDFLQIPTNTITGTAIITNPPFKHAEAFIQKALELAEEGGVVAMFLRTLFLESISRKKLFEENPPRYVMVSSRRINCWKPGHENASSAMSYSWFVFVKGYRGPTELTWFDSNDYK